MDENWGYFGYYFRKPPSVFFSKGSAFSLAVGFAVQQTSVVPGCLHSTPVGQTFCEMPRGTMCLEPKGHVATGETLTCQDLYRVVWGKKGEGAHPFRYSGKVVITLHVIAIVIAIVSATITGCFLHTGCSWRWRRAFPIFSRWKYCWVGKYLGQQQKPVACGTTIHFRLLMMFVPIFCEFLRVSMVPSPFSSIFTWFSPGVCFKSP